MEEGRKVTVHQPQYLPYAGTLAKILESDVYVEYDSADYQKNYFDNRNRIMTKNGLVWLTIPVHAALKQPIKEVRTVGQGWKAKHLKTIRQYYSRAPFFDEFFPFYEKGLAMESDWLVDYASATMDVIFDFLNKRPIVKKASALLAAKEMDATAKLVHFTDACNGEYYVAGPSWHEYMTDLKPFARRGLKFMDCKLEFQPYASAAVYAPYMSVIDLFFSLGSAASAQYLANSISLRHVTPQSCPEYFL